MRSSRRFPSRPSLREVRNELAVMAAMRDGTVPELEQPKPRAKQRAPEREVMDAVRAWSRTRPDVTLWRNNVGAVEWRPGKWLRYGLCTGSADYIGLKSVVITPEMVGQRVAIFTAIEAKAENGIVSPEQRAFLEAVRKAGGKAGIAQSAEDAEALLR